MSQLLLNFSVLMAKSTGISVYANNLLPAFQSLDPILFSVKPVLGFRAQKIPAGLSPDFGYRGHLKRLCWVQQDLSRQYHQTNDGLIFSPLPEAPLYSGCRYVVTAHDVIPLRFPQYFPFHLVSYFRHYVGQVMTQAEHIICNSVATAQDISRFFKVPTSKITPILLAYDLQHFQHSSYPVSNYFLYLGRQDTYKNLARLIAAFGQIYKRQGEIELWLVGPKDSRYTPALMGQIQSLGISHRVRFLDYVAYERLPELLGGAIALALPSLWEGFGLPVLEAMACGTPVITANISALPEVAGDAALLVDPYSVSEIADAMHSVVIDTQLRQQLREAGIERARQFSWEKTGQQTVEVLKRFM